jgi:hypothetical protein
VVLKPSLSTSAGNGSPACSHSLPRLRIGNEQHTITLQHNDDLLSRTTTHLDIWLFSSHSTSPRHFFTHSLLSKTLPLATTDLHPFAVCHTILKLSLSLLRVLRQVTVALDLPPTCTNAAYTLRKNYYRWLYAYECYDVHDIILSNEEVRCRFPSPPRLQPLSLSLSLSRSRALCLCE